MTFNFSFCRFAILFSAGLFCSSPYAASVTVQVVDGAGQPLADAVVYVLPESGPAFPKQQRPIEIEQKNRQFSPLVTVIQVGSAVLFPNNDTVKHHIYSYSPAKIFEQKLYSGVPAKPVIFDKPGVVVLGCNIHDQMFAYIFVVDTPYFAKTDATGRVNIDVPLSGKLHARAWHFSLPAGEFPDQPLIFKNAQAMVNFKLNIKAPAAKSNVKAPSMPADY